MYKKWFYNQEQQSCEHTFMLFTYFSREICTYIFLFIIAEIVFDFQLLCILLRGNFTIIR